MIESYSAECPEEVCHKVATPCYLISEDLIEKNCQLLQDVQERTGGKILLALKAFALPEVFPLISSYLSGVCASGSVEARLGYEDFRKEVHTYSPAYTATQFDRILKYSDHILFNSITQWQKYKKVFQKYALQCGRDLKAGLRVNPEYSEIKTALYNPCISGSRFGIKAEDLCDVDISGITGIHFHALCEQGAEVLENVLTHFENKFSKILSSTQISWVNFGGGHHITRSGYDVELLCRLITSFKAKYGVDVYLEPGEAVVLNAGFYLTTVIDIIHNNIDIAIIDGSAETHLPDILAMPYRPDLLGGFEAGLKRYTYRLGGNSCLAGDVIGDYSFADKLEDGDRLCFTDMALYSFVKNNTFNGVELPAIYSYSLKKNKLKLIREFSYNDYRDRIVARR